MNLSDCYLEEDLFPKIFTDYEERSYGILFIWKKTCSQRYLLIMKNGAMESCFTMRIIRIPLIQTMR